MKTIAAPCSYEMLSGIGNVRSTWRDGLLGEPAEQAQRGDAVARREAGAVRSADDLAGDLGARRERQVGLELVEPAALEHLGERDAGRAYADEHLVGGGFGAGELDELDR